MDEVVLRAVAFGNEDRQSVRHGLLHGQTAGAGQDEEVGLRKIRIKLGSMFGADELGGGIDLLRKRTQSRAAPVHRQ